MIIEGNERYYDVFSPSVILMDQLLKILCINVNFDADFRLIFAIHVTQAFEHVNILYIWLAIIKYNKNSTNYDPLAATMSTIAWNVPSFMNDTIHPNHIAGCVQC